MEQNNIQTIRQDLKSGTWYNKQKSDLQNDLNNWLQKCQQKDIQVQNIKSIIGPHAGLKFCGQTGAYSYQYLKPKKDLQVFLLGPSHSCRMDFCGLTQFQQFQTPLGNITINQQINDELLSQNNLFQKIPKDVDQNEHSLELHLPWIQHMLQQEKYTLIPIMVGQVNFKEQQEIGKILQKYYDNPNTVFIFSSDFCHWGKRFKYINYDEKFGQIWESIKHNDIQAMQIIEKHQHENFEKYLQDTQNTICGRRPIGIFLQIVQYSKLKQNLITKFLHYDQSNQCKQIEDSSVSYASSITYIQK